MSEIKIVPALLSLIESRNTSWNPFLLEPLFKDKFKINHKKSMIFFLKVNIILIKRYLKHYKILKNYLKPLMSNLEKNSQIILSESISTTVTTISGHFRAITAIVGPPTYPAPIQHIFLTFIEQNVFAFTQKF